MRIFLTGATGFIGSALIPQLLTAGHQVLGLTRSDAGAEKLIAAGAEPFLGEINNHKSLQQAVDISDGVIHTAFNHDFSTFLANCENDRLAINAMAAALRGSSRPLIITSAVALGSTGHAVQAVETHFNPDHPNPRKASELAGLDALNQGVNVSVVRLSQVHNTDKQGLITPLTDIARRKGVSAYVDQGLNRWSAVHLSDAASLYVLALEKARPGRRYHAVAEEGVTLRAIAETLGRRLNLPVHSLNTPDAAAHFGWMSEFAGRDMSASSALTQSETGWQPKGPGLLEDLAKVIV